MMLIDYKKKNRMSHLIKKFNEFNNNEVLESYSRFAIPLALIMGFGFNKAQAQEIQKDTVKSEVVKMISDYNSNPSGIDLLRRDLSNKVDGTDVFMKKCLFIDRDNKVGILPEFVKVNVDPMRRVITLGVDF